MLFWCRKAFDCKRNTLMIVVAARDLCSKVSSKSPCISKSEVFLVHARPYQRSDWSISAVRGETGIPDRSALPVNICSVHDVRKRPSAGYTFWTSREAIMHVTFHLGRDLRVDHTQTQ